MEGKHGLIKKDMYHLIYLKKIVKDIIIHTNKNGYYMKELINSMNYILKFQEQINVTVSILKT